MATLANLFAHRINESFDNPFPYTKISNSSFEIDAEGIPIKLILTPYRHKNLFYDISCLGVKIANPEALGDENDSNVTNKHGAKALRIFASIIEIISQIDFNLLYCFSSDDDIEIEGKKFRLYMTIFRKMQLLGKVNSVRNIRIDGIDNVIIVGERGMAKLTDENIESVLNSFINKLHDMRYGN